ncbi:MAG: Gfo/Idh/MocA family protein [Candidatus Hodarchaeales archaeon]|jgi:predicted dehydrogenase
MNFLIIGLGSMGKRRIRNLQALGYNPNQIYGFDVRQDRLDEIKSTYKVNIASELNDETWNKIDCVIISTPPDKHLDYLWMSAKRNKPVFVEASVILEGLEELNTYIEEKRLLIAASCTMRYHPSIMKIKEIVHSKKYGKTTSFYFSSGQYLPDWHPWEDIKDFYVSQRATGGCREIVPYELTWLVDVFGFPEEICGFNEKTSNLDADIDDVYVMNMKFSDFLGSLNVDVVARSATRMLIVNLENAQILWDWNTKQVKLYDAIEKRWVIYHEPEGTSTKGYEKNIIEEMYIGELQAFVNSVEEKIPFPNPLSEDIKVLKVLNLIEDSHTGVKV